MGMGLFYVTVFVFFLDVVVLVICWVFECWTWCFGGVVVVKCVAKLVRRQSANLVFGWGGEQTTASAKAKYRGLSTAAANAPPSVEMTCFLGWAGENKHCAPVFVPPPGYFWIARCLKDL
jgi:hypothetical protein